MTARDEILAKVKNALGRGDAAPSDRLSDDSLNDHSPLPLPHHTSLSPQQVASVVPHECDVHLQAAVVRRAVIGPRAFVPVDAEELLEMRRMQCAHVRFDGAPSPERAHPLGVLQARVVFRMVVVGRSGHAHQPLPVPRVASIRVDVREDRGVGFRRRRRASHEDRDTDCERSRERQKPQENSPQRKSFRRSRGG